MSMSFLPENMPAVSPVLQPVEHRMARLILGAVCIFLAGIARADDYQAAYDLLKRALTAQQPLIDRQETIKPKDVKREWPRTTDRQRRYAILPQSNTTIPMGAS
jgi:hypothetical protein